MLRLHFGQIVSCRGEQLLLPHRPAEIDTSSYCGQVEGELKPGSHYRTDPEGTAPRDQITKQSGKPLKTPEQNGVFEHATTREQRNRCPSCKGWVWGYWQPQTRNHTSG